MLTKGECQMYIHFLEQINLMLDTKCLMMVIAIPTVGRGKIGGYSLQHGTLQIGQRKLNGRWGEEDDKALEDLRNPKSVIIQAGYLTEREMEALKTVRVTASQDSNYPTMIGRLETNGQVFVDSIKQLTEELRHGTGFWSGKHEKVIVSNLPITKWGGVPYVLDSINAYALKIEPDELPEDLIKYLNEKEMSK